MLDTYIEEEKCVKRVTGESDGMLLAKREGRWARTLQRYIGNGGRNKMKG